MWARLRERLFNAVGIAVSISWLFASVAIAIGPVGVEAQRSNLWIVILIFLAPFAVVVVVEELVHRIKLGPTKPGRHLRTALDLDLLSGLDRGLKRGDDDAPAS